MIRLALAFAVIASPALAVYIPTPTPMMDGVSGRVMTLTDPDLIAEGLPADGVYHSPVSKWAIPAPVQSAPVAPFRKPRCWTYERTRAAYPDLEECGGARPRSEQLNALTCRWDCFRTVDHIGGGGGGSQTVYAAPVPLPPAVWMLIAGIMAIGGVKWRARRAAA